MSGQRPPARSPGGRVLVTGATGTVGSALTAALVSLGHAPRLLFRPGSAVGTPFGAERCEADLDDIGAMRRAFDGVGSLFLLTPLSPGQDRRQISLVEAAVAAGVERIVKVSALGADPSSPVTVHREHGRADRVLSRSGVSHAILRPNAFMQNVLQWRGMIARRGALELPMGQARVSMIDARDIAAVALRALLEPEQVNGVYDLTGPEALSYAEIAAYLSSAVGGDAVRYVEVAPELAADHMRAAGMPLWAVEARLGLYGSIRAGEAELVSSQVRRITGREPRRFPDFLARCGSALRAPV